SNRFTSWPKVARKPDRSRGPGLERRRYLAFDQHSVAIEISPHDEPVAAAEAAHSGHIDVTLLEKDVLPHVGSVTLDHGEHDVCVSRRALDPRDAESVEAPGHGRFAHLPDARLHQVGVDGAVLREQSKIDDGRPRSRAIIDVDERIARAARGPSQIGGMVVIRVTELGKNLAVATQGQGIFGNTRARAPLPRAAHLCAEVAVAARPRGPVLTSHTRATLANGGLPGAARLVHPSTGFGARARGSPRATHSTGLARSTNVVHASVRHAVLITVARLAQVAAAAVDHVSRA